MVYNDRVMTTKPFLESPLWEQFQSEARKRHEDPVDVVAAYLRQCLETWQDEALDEQIGYEARQSGYGEEDAVELVRRSRREKAPHAAS